MNLNGSMDNELNKTHERRRWAAMQRVDYSKYQSDIKTARQHYDKPSPKKNPVKKKRRQELKSDAIDKPCIICGNNLHYQLGAPVGPKNHFSATIEHKLPWRLGGTNKRDNLDGQMCYACNNARGLVLRRGNQKGREWSEDFITRYIIWLNLQYDDFEASQILFPDLHNDFVDSWKSMTKKDWLAHGNAEIRNHEQFQSIIGYRPGFQRRRSAKIDMSASARYRRNQNRKSM